jgi:transcription initiation factor TFIIIB Brf1 subunit/transcription initiation factor TFIIB
MEYPINCVDCNKELGMMSSDILIFQSEVSRMAGMPVCEDCDKVRQEKLADIQSAPSLDDRMKALEKRQDATDAVVSKAITANEKSIEPLAEGDV